MSNAYYNYSGAFIPGTLARAEAIASEFNSVAAGFALLSTQGDDTGTATAYVVTTEGAPTAYYADGQNIQFKTSNANTGSATINVNGIGSASLLRYNGASLQAGDLIANGWYNAVYNSTLGGFCVTGPVPVSTSTSTVSGAAPTNKVGLVAAGGSSTSVVPIDATYAIDQSIAPTWTGLHSFTAGLTVSKSSGNSLTVTSAVAGSAAAKISSTATSGSNYGLDIVAGTSGASSDYALRVYNSSSSLMFGIVGNGAVSIYAPTTTTPNLSLISANSITTNPSLYLFNTSTSTGIDFYVSSALGGRIRNTSSEMYYVSAASSGTGHAFYVGGDSGTGTLAMYITSAGNVLSPAPTSGVSFSVTGYSASNALQVTSGSGSSTQAADVAIYRAGSTANTVLAGPNLVLSDTTNLTATGFQESGGQFELWHYASSAWTQRLKVSTAGAFTIVAPTSGDAFSSNGASGYYAGAFFNTNTSTNSNGLKVYAGSSTANYSLVVGNSTVTANYLLIRGDGAFTFTANGAQAGYNFEGSATTSTYTAGGLAAPTTVAGYWQIQINSTNFRIPLCN